MNLLENCLLLLGLPIGMVLAGYWLAARLSNSSAAERLALATLAGLALLLWNIAAVNFFKPLSGVWAWLCLWPIAVTIVYSPARTRLLRDVSAVALNKRGILAATLTTVIFGVLLWPLLSRPALVFYDGTSNHDAFFWIASSEHLKRHSYMERPETSAVHPLSNATPAIIGWRPLWGRMGAEGLLALTSSIIGLAPLKLYLAATATLFVPWIAGVFLALRTFWVRRLSLLGVVALIGMQPVFVFFHGNSNLPNFMGALMAAAAVVATERIHRPEAGRSTWIIVLVLAVHGLICTYPEMIPFVVLPAGLLWWRVWFVRGASAGWKPAALCLAGWIAGIAINPASSVRAWIGFITSFQAARANENWANLFQSLSNVEYIPALATLSVVTAKGLDPVTAILVTLALVPGLALAFWRATDRIGALFSLAGSITLLGYTLYTGFNYGWQKTVQFGGVFWAAVLPVAVIQALVQFSPANAFLRTISRATLVGTIALFGYATIANCLDGYKWSERKILTEDWFSLRDYSRHHLPSAPVLVEAASFRMAFFHSMWATYFLSQNELYFAKRGEEAGGYVRDSIAREGAQKIPVPAAYLVGREWAESFDANSERLFTGDTLVLLKSANRVTHWEGFHPDNGIPENAYATIKIELLPHSASELKLELQPRYTGEGQTQLWKITRHVDNLPPYTAEVSGPPPWKITVPLEANKSNRIQLTADPSPPEMAVPPFTVHGISVQTRVEQTP